MENLYGLGLIGHAIECIELQILPICAIHIFMIINRVCNIKTFHIINEMCCLFFTRIRLIHIIFFLGLFTFDTCFHILCALVSSMCIVQFFVTNVVPTPLLEECEDEIHTPEMGDLGVHQDFRNFNVQLQGSKHLTLGCSLYHWKAIET